MYLKALEGYGEALGFELVKTYTPALKIMWVLGDLYSRTRPNDSQAMYTEALSGYTKVQGASSGDCVHLRQRLIALNISKPQAVIPEPGTSPGGQNSPARLTSQKRKRSQEV